MNNDFLKSDGIVVLSLFDGMSCGQIALERANIKVKQYYASEIDVYAMKVTQHNYPNTIQLGSVTDIKVNELPQIDLLIGGSPCQSFSNAGKQTGFIGKSGLFWEYIRILREAKPKYFLLENVVMKKKWKTIISNELGVRPILLNSNSFSAQNRQRLYWTNISNIIPLTDKGILLKDIIDTNIIGNLSEEYINHRLNQKRWGNHFGNLNTKKSNTLCAIGKSDVILLKDLKRYLTPLECERLQTVPDEYTSVVSDGHRYSMIGNGWTVDVIAYIFSFLHELNTESLFEIDNSVNVISTDIIDESTIEFPYMQSTINEFFCFDDNEFDGESTNDFFEK